MMKLILILFISAQAAFQCISAHENNFTDCIEETFDVLRHTLGEGLTENSPFVHYTESTKARIRTVCLHHCFDPFTPTFQQALDNLNTNPAETDSIRKVFLEPSEITALCTKFNKSVAFIERCPPKDYRTRLDMTWVELFTHICDRSNYVNHVQCYREVFDETETKCNFQCKEELATFTMELHRPVILNEKGLAPFPREYFETGCNYTSCKKQCRADIVSQKCGAASVEQLDSLYHAVFTMIDYLLKTSTDYATKSALPPACRAMVSAPTPGTAFQGPQTRTVLKT